MRNRLAGLMIPVALSAELRATRGNCNISAGMNQKRYFLVKLAVAASALIDFMLSTTFQQYMPLNMFVFPVRQGTPLPDVVTRFAQVAPHPFLLLPGQIGRNRDTWIRQWTDTVLR